LQRLDELEANLPNGDISLLLSKMENLSDDVAKIAVEFNKLKLNVYNPESGVIVRVNRNSEFRKSVETG
jgi:glycine cleavage system H lipoate-binding protein